MDRIQKFMRKIDRKLRDRVESAMEAILLGKLDGYDVRELEGYKHSFRLRIGTIRIIFEKVGDVFAIVDVGFRKDVYKRLK